MSDKTLTTEHTELTEARKGLNELTDCGYRADLIVDGRLLVEIKASEQISAIHDAQLLSYLKLSGMRVGLLINFNVRILTQGVHRKVLGPPEEVSL